MSLDREKVVRAALRLLDQAGLDGLTLRGLAKELRVQAPALYWHFRSKQELLDEMATRVLADSMEEMLPGAKGNWRAWALHFGRGVRRMLLRHRDGAKMLSGTYLTDSSLCAPMEGALRKFVDAGFSGLEAARAFRTIYCYAVGFAIEEQAVYPQTGKRAPRYDPMRRSRRIDPDRFPILLATGEKIYKFDAEFEKGLRVIIHGLEK